MKISFLPSFNHTFPFILALLIIISGCKKNETNNTEFKGLVLPSHFPAVVQNMGGNVITKDGFELGRKLFYDPILSRDNTISCGSCHIQGSGFTHHGHDVSHGIDDKLGRRNALPIQNLLWQSSYFWDGGVHNIDMISLNPIENPVEMDEDPVNVLNKLRSHPQYPALFKKAFGTEDITTTRFLQAMTQFQAMLISANSKYDKYKRGETTLSANEMDGLNLFNQKCAQCHSGELFSDNSFRNNGITNDFTNDQGRYEISLISSDIGKYKVPSLRNVAKTAPYMHTGTLETLEEVLNHYTGSVKDAPSLDPLLKNGSQLGLSITSAEKQKIIAFLNTLTDEEFIRNPLFAEQ